MIKILRATKNKIKTVISKLMIKILAMNASRVRVIVGAGGTSYVGWISTDYPALDVADEKS